MAPSLSVWLVASVQSCPSPVSEIAQLSFPLPAPKSSRATGHCVGSLRQSFFLSLLLKAISRRAKCCQCNGNREAAPLLFGEIRLRPRPRFRPHAHGYYDDGDRRHSLPLLLQKSAVGRKSRRLVVDPVGRSAARLTHVSDTLYDGRRPQGRWKRKGRLARRSVAEGGRVFSRRNCGEDPGVPLPARVGTTPLPSALPTLNRADASQRSGAAIESKIELIYLRPAADKIRGETASSPAVELPHSGCATFGFRRTYGKAQLIAAALPADSLLSFRRTRGARIRLK